MQFKIYLDKEHSLPHAGKNIFIPTRINSTLQPQGRGNTALELNTMFYIPHIILYHEDNCAMRSNIDLSKNNHIGKL